MLTKTTSVNRPLADATKALLGGGVSVLATDTLYGLVARAEDRAAVERVYDLKSRHPEKPCLILIGEIEHLSQFGVELSAFVRGHLDANWPGPVSIVMDCRNEGLEYLHRGTQTLGFRLPAKAELRELLRATGPLIAPSANPEGQSPAMTVEAAREYFGDAVDIYVAGETTDKPSKIIRLTSGAIEILRA